MMESITVRRASRRDENAVAGLLGEYNATVRGLPATEHDEVVHYICETVGLWLAEAANEIAGCVVLRSTSDIPMTALEIKRLYVRPEWRRRGIAGRLLDAVEMAARDAGFRSVYLDSRDDMREALRLYRGRGFEAIERYNDGMECGVFMRKWL